MAIRIGVYAVPVQAPRQRSTFDHVARSSDVRNVASNVSSAAFGVAAAAATAVAAAAALCGVTSVKADEIPRISHNHPLLRHTTQMEAATFRCLGEGLQLL
eukprot:4221478-Pleurochrysis_carterae.AAC.1